ncbi:NAD-dependent epimerase/dehydratase family protein [Priestia taiwanensis]|uniref:NAD dependent epimerase/dehydratase n=1 Tax=Priestia taiwanensis TaxID=1347902 RepID=A0A917AQT1_9BACI|nr:NAD-dependent epimerase/dehydratase family protein [Priestia taiwanensis]MBM7363232.1 nucleoside-diphosphate-sugar epimerase [Priestia taiwanensis]GGE68752.1 NAD dependent epimerase/dehydratase [Priestia taiwanensis]
MNILVLGGTRFFGKKLVESLLEEGHNVTIATRGNTADDFGDRVKRVRLERTSSESLKEVADADEWDVVYDNICYSPNDALYACEAFAGKVKRYIFTSTLAVYPFGATRNKEEDFNPFTYPIKFGNKSDFDYAEGKKQCEAVFFQKATFPVCAVRFPIVLGEDDYTRRLEFHSERIAHEMEIGMPNIEAIISFIHSNEAATFLSWLKDASVEGPINACAGGEISLADLLTRLEEQLGKKAIVIQESTPDNHSPYGLPDSWYMETIKAKNAGFVFTELEDWLGALIRRL